MKCIKTTTITTTATITTTTGTCSRREPREPRREHSSLQLQQRPHPRTHDGVVLGLGQHGVEPELRLEAVQDVVALG